MCVGVGAKELGGEASLLTDTVYGKKVGNI